MYAEAPLRRLLHLQTVNSRSDLEPYGACCGRDSYYDGPRGPNNPVFGTNCTPRECVIMLFSCHPASPFPLTCYIPPTWQVSTGDWTVPEGQDDAGLLLILHDHSHFTLTFHDIRFFSPHRRTSSHSGQLSLRSPSLTLTLSFVAPHIYLDATYFFSSLLAGIGASGLGYWSSSGLDVFPSGHSNLS